MKSSILAWLCAMVVVLGLAENRAWGLFECTKAKGTTYFTCNKVHNLTYINYPSGTPDVHYYYDNAHRLTSFVDGMGSTAMSYTNGGRLAYEDGPWASDRVTSTYTDGFRTRLALQRPGTSDWVVDYQYDPAHRLAKVTSPSGVYDYIYDTISSKVDYLNINPTGSGTDLKIDFEYDPVNRITRTELKQGSTILNKHEYVYNKAGWATSHTLPGSSIPSTLGYDEIGQLESATGYNGTNYTYAYDDGRNLDYRIRGGVTEQFSVNNTNDYTQTHNGSATYDDNGNILSDGANTYQYDAANRLIQANYFDGAYYQQENFSYDGLSRLRRIYTIYSPNSVTWYFGEDIRLVYDGRQIIQERNQSNAIIATYTRGKDLSGGLSGAGGIGGILSRSNSSSTSHGYYHSDRAGSITKIVSSAGANLATYQYDPYGFLLSQSGHFAWVNTNPFRFSSKYYMDSGISSFGYRFYNPDLQRWLNRDPIGEAGGINLYGYVGNGPIIYIDAYGLCFWSDVGDGLQIAGAFAVGFVVDGTANLINERIEGITGIPQMISDRQESLSDAIVSGDALLIAGEISGAVGDSINTVTGFVRGGGGRSAKNIFGVGGKGGKGPSACNPAAKTTDQLSEAGKVIDKGGELTPPCQDSCRLDWNRF